MQNGGSLWGFMIPVPNTGSNPGGGVDQKQKNFVQRTSNKCSTEFFRKFVFVFLNLLKSIIVQAKLSFTSQSKINNSK